MKQDFVHLHVHSEYSPDGICRIDELIRQVRELGQKAVALTDHGALYGAAEFYKAAKRAGIKPIIGCEVYVAAQTRFDKQDHLEASPAHLTLLCENNEGYHNLLKLVSESWLSGFDKNPRTDKPLLEKYHGGLIALSDCQNGEIPRALLAGDFEWAKEAALYYESVFGKENFFLEIQNHGIPAEKQVMESMIRLSNETGIPLVCTNDVHYTLKDDAKAQRVLTCIQKGTTIREADGVKNDEFYIKSNEEMRSLFPELPSAFDNTAKIAERCCAELIFGEQNLPAFIAVSAKKHPNITDCIKQKNGKIHAALCADFLVRSGESVIRDAAQVLAIPSDVAERVANLIPWHSTIEFEEETSNELQYLIKNDTQTSELIKIAKKLENTLSRVTEKTEIVIISPIPISDFIPLCVINGQVVTQYPFSELNELGFMRLPLLNEPYLIEIDETEKIIRQIQPDFSIDGISLNEEDVYRMLSEGKCDNIFHIEASEIKQLLKDIKPKNFEQFTALIGLCCSHPIDTVATYIEGHRLLKRNHFPIHQLKPILDSTYGCIIYTEQIIQIFHNLAGYSLSRAEIGFHIIASNRQNETAKEREIFIHGLTNENGQYVADGCLCRAVAEDTANALFDEIISAAPHALFKAHVASYALIIYKAAYLKCFYPNAWNVAIAKNR